MKQSKKIANFQGTCTYPECEGEITGKIELELREDCVYYSWYVITGDGNAIAGKSLSVSLRIIPKNEDEIHVGDILIEAMLCYVMPYLHKTDLSDSMAT